MGIFFCHYAPAPDDFLSNHSNSTNQGQSAASSLSFYQALFYKGMDAQHLLKIQTNYFHKLAKKVIKYFYFFVNFLIRA